MSNSSSHLESRKKADICLTVRWSQWLGLVKVNQSYVLRIEEKRKQFDMMCCVVSLFLWTVTINVRFKSPNAGHNVITISNVNECSFRFSYRRWWMCWFLRKKDMAALQKSISNGYTLLVYYTTPIPCFAIPLLSICDVIWSFCCSVYGEELPKVQQ